MKVQIHNPLAWVLTATALTIGGASLLQYTVLGPLTLTMLQALYEMMSLVSRTWQAGATCFCILGFAWLASWGVPTDTPGLAKKMAWLLGANFGIFVVFCCFAAETDQRVSAVMGVLCFGVMSGLVYGRYEKHK